MILGCANQAGEDNRNVARMAALLAGLPVSVPGVTVNRLCGSGMQAVADAARLIATGEADLVIAGGVEQMSRAPLVMAQADRGVPARQPDALRHDARLALRQPAHGGDARHARDGRDRRAGRRALQRLARGAGSVRADARSSAPARRSRRAGSRRSSRRSSPASTRRPAPRSTSPPTSTRGPRRRSSSSRSSGPRSRKDDGTVTAGNASGLNDGAAALLLASEPAIEGARPDAQGALRHRRRRRRRAELHGPRADPGHARRRSPGRELTRATHRSRRAQRGVRRAGDAVHRADRPRSRAGQRQRRRDRAGATRSVPRARGWS